MDPVDVLLLVKTMLTFIEGGMGFQWVGDLDYCYMSR